jgi:transcription initiation factor TFIIE subunit beta
VLFYNDKNSADNIEVDEEIIKYWRDVPVEGLDETKIEDYLEKQGITQMKDVHETNFQPIKDKKKASRRGKPSKTHNEHLGDKFLNEYNPDMNQNKNKK